MDFETSSDGSSYGENIPTRPMRVKVLYSFDEENKTNCLARLPNTLQIPAVAIDESSQVGVIELQQCIQAVTTASPEIVSKLSDGNFTIYAYDYSEPDTPLVGQGMLSTALTSASSPAAEKVMITGRVCKNLPGLFSGGVKETLEVKLRLAPVSKPAATAVLPKAMSPATSAGFDPNAWSVSMQQSRSQQQANSFMDFGGGDIVSDRNMALVDEMFGLGSGSSGSGSGQQMMGGVGMAETPTDPTYGFNPAFSHSAPGSRAGSPMMGSDSGTHNEQLRHQSFSAVAPNFAADQSRPGSRASVRSEVRQPSRHQHQASSQSVQQHQLQPQVEVDYDESGQARKRAKVTQAEWRGRSSFGGKSGDLRVTAATAHSMQMHRPVPKRPGAPGADLEPPPRVPTPVPRMHPVQQQRPLRPIQSRSFLRQASTMTTDSDLLSDADQFSDAIMSSPEENSPNNSITAEGTPQDIPSSPPMLMGFNQPQPSSPGLPTLPQPRLADSGYMSERGLHSDSRHMLEGFDDDENRSPDAEDLEVAAQYRARSQPIIKNEGSDAGYAGFGGFQSDAIGSDMNVEMEMPGDMNQLPQRMRLEIPPAKARTSNQGPKPPRAQITRAKDNRAIASTPAADEQPIRPELQSRRSSLALPPNPTITQNAGQAQATQRPAPKRRTTTKRPRTDAPDSEAGSPAPSDTEGGKPRGPRRSGSGAQRRVIIQQRLETALATGAMPQYCVHCGAIETPTWRKLYCKYVDGKPSALDEAEGEGETIGVEQVEWDEESGECVKFVIRKSMKKTKDCLPGEGFEDVTVCNPCGLWFNKFRSMRPAEKWGRKSTSRRSKKQKDAGAQGGGDGLATDGAEPQSEAFFTDAVGPEDAVEREPSAEQQDQTDGAAEVSRPQPAPPSRRPRASSLQPQPRRRSADGPNASQLDAALTRAVQSSPVPFRGSQESPIELEDPTPKPTRRLLFPSPRREGEVKSLDDNGQASLHATPLSDKGSVGKPSSSLKAAVTFEAADVNVFEAFTFDKENMAPGMELDDELMQLFQGWPTAVFKTPLRKTPSKASATPRSQCQLDQLLKTPTPTSRKRKPLSPNPNAANNATMINDFMTSPSSSRYFLRSTPSREQRTPGRSISGGSTGHHHHALGAANEMTPFSRHLAQMLSDANDGGVAFTSPSKALDFSDLPTFSTPGRNLADGVDWNAMEEILSSEFAAFEDGGVGKDGAQQ